MTIPFQCPHCNHHTEVAEAFAGHSGPCAGCGRTVAVPVPDYLGRVEAPPALQGRQLKGSTWALIAAGVLFGLLSLLAIVLFVKPYLTSTSGGDPRATAECQEKLNRITAAIQSYAQDHGHYPPAYTVDPKTGLPLHSWRVLILPYLGEETLYSKIDQSQPWDSPRNLQFQTQMPEIYHCSAHSALSGAFTHYVAVEGDGLFFSGSKRRTPAEITDDPATLIVVVEVANSTINWMSPMDLHDSGVGNSIGNDPNSVSSLHGDGEMNVGNLNGRAELISRQNVSASEFHARMTIAGND